MDPGSAAHRRRGAALRRGHSAGLLRQPRHRRLPFNLHPDQRGENSMIDARCSCGALALSLPGPSQLVVACHCVDCQRRTGAPFGVGAFYPVETVTITGTPKPYVRTAASGGKVRSYFCPDCGSTVYWQAENFACDDRRCRRRDREFRFSTAHQISVRAVETWMGGDVRCRALPARQRAEAFKLKTARQMLVPAEGIEPPTFGLQNRCSTAELSRRRLTTRVGPAWAGVSTRCAPQYQT